MDLRTIGIVLILVSVAILSGAQLLIKSRLNVHGVVPFSAELVPYLAGLLRDWRLWVGGVGLILAALAWYAGVSRIPLSLAFPIGALSYLVIFAGTVSMLGESFSWAALAGNLLIVGGVALVAFAH